MMAQEGKVSQCLAEQGLESKISNFKTFHQSASQKGKAKRETDKTAFKCKGEKRIV